MGFRTLGAGAAALVTGLLMGPAQGLAAVDGGSPRFCARGETPLFACMAGAKGITMCAHGASVRYRYGPPGRPELIYPAEGGAGTLYRASAAFSGGGEAQIGFIQGPYRYVVYSRVVRGEVAGGGDSHRFEAGVFIRRGDALLADRRCTRPADAAVDLDAAERLLPEGPFIYPDD